MANLLSIGKSGLDASKKALKTTGHNIANVNTEGYSRQRVQQSANSPVTSGGVNVGTGVKVDSVNRISDEYVEKRLNKTTSDNEYYSATSDRLAEVEMIFNDIDGNGLHSIINEFFNSFRDLANQPENETMRSVVRDKAGLVVKDFKRISSTLNEISNGIDSRISHDVDTINTITNKIAKLNGEIRKLEAGRGETGDLRDQRDLEIKNLSKYFSVNTYVDDDGNYNVDAQGVGTLVAGKSTQELTIKRASKDESGNGIDGAKEIYLKNRPASPITSKFRGGSFSGLTKVRNDHIAGLQEKMDKIAFEFMNAVNAVHRQGYVHRHIEMNSSGEPVPFDGKGPTTGINFFEDPMLQAGAAERMKLSDDVLNDVTNIATSLKANSPGDNRISVAISKLQHEKILENGEASIEDSYLKSIGNVGLEASKAKMNLEHSTGLLAQAQGIRERLSGVSIDEETANMMRYQQAYDASAKVLKAADEMFQTVLSIKR
ncbi:MAG: flagellar hook-associated protein FlgK [Bacteriovoracaceae bacterium]